MKVNCSFNIPFDISPLYIIIIYWPSAKISNGNFINEKLIVK